MSWNADVDIDVKSHTNTDDYGVRAIIFDKQKEDIRPHPSGHYIDTNIPLDPDTGLSSIEHKDAETMGYVKIDLLTNTAYNIFDTKEDMLIAAELDPDWSLLEDEEFIQELPQVQNHHELLAMVKPQSIEELADCIAMIRPGKTKFVADYLKDKEKVRKNLYRRAESGMSFKKSHAIAYAIQIVCIMNKRDTKCLFKF